MRRFVASLLVLAVATVTLPGCGQTPAAAAEPSNITTTPPATTAGSLPMTTATVTTPAENRLQVTGLVSTPLDLSYEQVTALPAVTEEAVLYCPGVYENQPIRDWRGVLLSTLLAQAGAAPDAGRMVFTASDGYKMTISFEKAAASRAILAWQVDGAALNQGDGFPFRLVVPDMNGEVWIRWVTRIEVA